MFDFDDTPDLEKSLLAVLSHPAFSQYSAESLSSCDNFCEMLRQAPHDAIKELQAELQEIALETNDHNEASGFLLQICTLGGGFTDSPADHNDSKRDIPLDDLDNFVDWVCSLSAAERKSAYLAVLDASMKCGLRLKPDDRAGRLRKRLIDTVSNYCLNDVGSMLKFGNFATENFSFDFNLSEQIPLRLWEAFQSRGEDETSRLITKWWGPKANVPQDFFIALAWQQAGHITIHRGKNYLESVAEYLLNCCEPGNPNDKFGPRSSYGLEALSQYNFLADDLYEALSVKSSYRWLISRDVQICSDYLNSLFEAQALDRSRVIAALEHGIAKKWDAPLLDSYKELLARLAA